MNVSFSERVLRRNYESYAEGTRRWGEIIARKYIDRVARISAAASWDDVRQFAGFRAHQLHGDRQGQWATTLAGRWRLTVEPNIATATVVIVEVSNHSGD